MIAESVSRSAEPPSAGEPHAARGDGRAADESEQRADHSDDQTLTGDVRALRAGGRPD